VGAPVVAGRAASSLMACRHSWIATSHAGLGAMEAILQLRSCCKKGDGLRRDLSAEVADVYIAPSFFEIFRN